MVVGQDETAARGSSRQDALDFPLGVLGAPFTHRDAVEVAQTRMVSFPAQALLASARSSRVLSPTMAVFVSAKGSVKESALPEARWMAVGLLMRAMVLRAMEWPVCR